MKHVPEISQPKAETLHQIRHPRDEPVSVAAGAVSLAQGFPDFRARRAQGGCRAAVADDINQYAITWGAKPLRDAIAATKPHQFPLAMIPKPKSPSPAARPRR